MCSSASAWSKCSFEVDRASEELVHRRHHLVRGDEVGRLVRSAAPARAAGSASVSKTRRSPRIAWKSVSPHSTGKSSGVSPSCWQICRARTYGFSTSGAAQPWIERSEKPRMSWRPSSSCSRAGASGRAVERLEAAPGQRDRLAEGQQAGGVLGRGEELLRRGAEVRAPPRRESRAAPRRPATPPPGAARSPPRRVR